jgi:hypothetical protein
MVGLEPQRGMFVACEVWGFEEEVKVEVVGVYGGSVIVGICVETRESRVSSRGVGAITENLE